MAWHFLFPSHPLRDGEVDPTFADQWHAMQAAGHTVSLCPDAVIERGHSLRNLPLNTTVVLRGWMLKPDEYIRLTHAIVDAGATPLTTPAAYIAAHYLPNWYPVIADFTPETHVFPIGSDYAAGLLALGWNAYFIKDFVKSLKTGCGSILHDATEIDSVIAEMQRTRGPLEGGLCVRRVEPFIADTERRYFVINGVPHDPSESEIPDIVRQVAVHIGSRFFSVDVIRREDGVLRVVEVGDGQVSDLVGWTAAAFAASWIQ